MFMLVENSFPNQSNWIFVPIPTLKYRFVESNPLTSDYQILAGDNLERTTNSDWKRIHEGHPGDHLAWVVLHPR